MTETNYELRPIGCVESSLVDLADAPRQGDEGAPDAWLVLRPEFRPAMRGLRPGDHIVVLTWLHRGKRHVLEVHPRDDAQRAVAGVFATRSQDRPNPIGLHTVQILAIVGPRIHVSDLEAIDETPILDIKPVLGPIADR